MSARDNGGAAFPAIEGQPGGMSLRDYFAAQAINLAAIAAAGNVIKGEPVPDHAVIATDCYRLADAMLAARQVKP